MRNVDCLNQCWFVCRYLLTHEHRCRPLWDVSARVCSLFEIPALAVDQDSAIALVSHRWLCISLNLRWIEACLSVVLWTSPPPSDPCDHANALTTTPLTPWPQRCWTGRWPKGTNQYWTITPPQICEGEENAPKHPTAELASWGIPDELIVF